MTDKPEKPIKTPTDQRCAYCDRILSLEPSKTSDEIRFCSRKCRMKYAIVQRIEKLIRFFIKVTSPRTEKPTATATPNIPEPSSTDFHPTLLWIIILVVAMSILANFLFYYKIKKVERRLNQIRFVANGAQINLNQPKEMNILRPRPEAMVTRNYIDIEGEAPNNCFVCILNNGAVVAVDVVKNGQFSFKKIPVNRNVNHLVVKSISDSGTTISLEEFNITYQPPTPSYMARNFIRGDVTLKQVALTFDGDYLNNVSQPILDILEAKNIPATFFLTARFIDRYQETVKQMVAEGHEVGNHTWSHPHLTQFEEKREHLLRPEVTREFVAKELTKTAELFKKVTGAGMSHIWRAPFGEQNAQIRAWAAELGYRQIGWTIDRELKLSLDTMDWVADTTSTMYRRPDEILTRILRFADESDHGANGGIILMHLGSERKNEFPYQIISAVIDSLHARDYEFVSISSMTF